MRFFNSTVRALLNLAMFIVHLVLPIVLLETRKAYYHIRISSPPSYRYDYYHEEYFDCTDSDTYSKEDPQFYDSCNYNAPAKFPHGPVHKTCIIFWVIWYVPLFRRLRLFLRFLKLEKYIAAPKRQSANLVVLFCTFTVDFTSSLRHIRFSKRGSIENLSGSCAKKQRILSWKTKGDRRMKGHLLFYRWITRRSWCKINNA